MSVTSKAAHMGLPWTRVMAFWEHSAPKAGWRNAKGITQPLVRSVIMQHLNVMHPIMQECQNHWSPSTKKNNRLSPCSKAFHQKTKLKLCHPNKISWMAGLLMCRNICWIGNNTQKTASKCQKLREAVTNHPISDIHIDETENQVKNSKPVVQKKSWVHNC